MELIIALAAFAFGFLLGRMSIGNRNKDQEPVSAPVMTPVANVEPKPLTAPTPEKESEPTPTEKELGDPSLFCYEPCKYYGTEGIEITGYADFDTSKVIIPSKIDGLPVISIGKKAFINRHISLIVFPSSLRNICEYAFYGCKGLRSIDLPFGVKEIGDNAFRASSLSSITLPESVTTLGYSAFADSSLKEITFPSSLTSIPTCCCYNCHNLQKVIIPNGVKEVDDSAFELVLNTRYRLDTQNKLTSIYFPASVERIGRKVLESRNQTVRAFAGMNTEIPYEVYGAGTITAYVLPGSKPQQYGYAHRFIVRPLSEYPYK